jgi:L-asparaginase II
MRSSVLVEVTRGGTIESRHRGTLVVVDCQGGDLHVAGDPDSEVFIRSVVKPLAAVQVVASGAADTFDFGTAELAVISGSHGGLDEDARIVTGILERIGCSEADLRNGSDGPSDERTKARFTVSGEQPGPIRQMCSGEHAGILALARQLEVPTDGYTDPDHPAGRSIESLLERVLLRDGPMDRAIDNCAIPTWRAPLAAIARAYAWLARPERLPDSLSDLRVPFQRVRDAMVAHPERISGPGQLDTDLTAVDGFIAKEGSEGLIAIGSIGSGLGLAIGIEDGDPQRRAASVVAISALGALRLLDEDAERSLREEHWSPITDSLSRTVGEQRPAFHLPAAE